MSRALIVIALLGCATPVLATAAPATADSATFGTHSVVSQTTAYVMTESNSGAELVAVDLVTGKRRWSSTTAVKPIIARGDKLVALDGAGKVLVLDARTGKQSAPCGAIAITAPFVDGLGVNQSASGFDDGTTLSLTWSRSTHYAGGAAPPPDVEKRARTQTTTTWALDLGACTAKVIKAPVVPPRWIDKTTNVTTASGRTARIVFDAAKKTVSLAPAASPAAKPIDLTRGDPTRTSVSISSDRRFVLCGHPPTKALAMFDLDTGAVSHPAIAFPSVFTSTGTQIIVWNGSVAAYDASTGKLLWTVPERNTTYRGPYPPSAAR